MSPGRIAFLPIWIALIALFAIAPAYAQIPCTPALQNTVACFSPATNLQLTDLLTGMQAVGPQRSPQSVSVTPQQLLTLFGSPGALTLTDGTHTVTPTGQITVTGATVGGASPNATLTITGGGGGSTLTFGPHLTGGSYNGGSPITLGTDATNANTASTIVARDSSGNFTAGTITGALTGAASLNVLLTQLGTNSVKGIIEGDGSTINCVAGVCTAIGGSATSIVPGTTTIGGGGSPCFIVNSTGSVMACDALGANVATALGIAVGSAGGPVTNGGALGTPSGGTATNLTGTAASLTAGTATAANGLKSATTTVSVSGATAPTSGQALVATSGTNATWQTLSGSGVSITVDPTTPNLAVTPSPITGTGVIKSQTLLISSPTSPYIYNGTGTSGTGAQIDNTYLIELSAASAAMTLPQAGTTGFAADVGSMVVPTGTGTTTITPTTSTIAGLASITLVPHQFLSFGSDGTNYEAALGMPPSGTQNLVIATPNGSTGQPKLRALVAADIPNLPGSIINSGTVPNANLAAVNLAATGNGGITGTLPNASVAAAPLPTPGSVATLAAPRSYYVCTTTCTVTLPTPAAGYEFCARNDNNVSTVITFAAITSVQFENTNFTSYKTANTSIVSGGAAGDKLCVLGRDSTHYLVMSFNGTWS